MNEAQHLNLPAPVVGSIVGGAVSICLFVLTTWWNTERERRARSREMFSKAYAAVQMYKEFPYVIRRRRKNTPEEERVRISSELRKVQADLAFYSAWLRTESFCVHHSFVGLLEQVRRVAGTEMRQAWSEPAIEDDSEMNIPDFGLSALESPESAYLEEVVDHLSAWPRWFRRFSRARRSANH